MGWTRLSIGAGIGLFAMGCDRPPTGPLDPPEGLAVALRDSARIGEMTWVDLVRPFDDTGAVTLESSDPATLAIDVAGRAFPLRAGTVTITARSAALSGTAQVRIAEPSDSFGISFKFRWTPTEPERQVFARAAMRWRRMLRQSAGWTVDLPAGACHAGTQAERIQYQGVVILVDRFDDQSVGPNVTGTAGPCVVDAAGRTLVGAMALRRSFSDLAAALSGAPARTWENQFVRQIGQALGLAGHAMTGVPRPELDRSEPSNPRWLGPAAVAAYRAMGGAETGVPITADLTSWRADLGTEGDAMLAAITAQRRISAVSVGALADRGYLADPTRAEPPPPPDLAAAVAVATTAWAGPLWVYGGAERPRLTRVR
ncbi:MAG: Ig domain-containing protein [Gemmatimonadales bacterium]